MEGGIKNWRFSTNSVFYFGNGTLRYGRIATTEDEYEFVCDLSNGAISNDLERS